MSFATAGVDPAFMGIGPIDAVPKALRKAGVFSGKASRMGADLPPFVVDRDESGAATGAHEGK